MKILAAMFLLAACASTSHVAGVSDGVRVQIATPAGERSGTVRVERVTAPVGGKPFTAVALSLYDAPTSQLWYSVLHGDNDLSRLRTEFVPRLVFGSNSGNIAAFDVLGRALFVHAHSIRASEAAARTELLERIVPREISMLNGEKPELPDAGKSIDLYDALGFDFADKTFHELPRTELLGLSFDAGEWRLRIRNGEGETRVLRLDRDFRPIPKER